MRRTGIVLVFLAVLFAPSAAAQPEVSVRGNVGAAFFQSPEGLNNVLNSGVNLGLGAGVQLYGGLELVLQGGYDRFTLNGDNIALLEQGLNVGSKVEGGDLDVLNGTIGLRYTLETQGDVHPYVSGGVGLYRTVLAETIIHQSDQVLPERRTTGRGFHVAIGSNFRIDDTYAFFFEPRLVVVDTQGSELDTSTPTRYVTFLLGVDVLL
jgi:opacity protein-like surface antigen